MTLVGKFKDLYLLLDNDGRRRLIILFVASLCVGILESIAFSSVAPVAQQIFEVGDSQSQEMANTSPKLQIATLLLLGAFLLRTLLLVALSYYQATTVFQIQAALSERLFKKYLSHDSKTQTNISHLAKNVILEAQNITQHGYLPMLAVISDILIAVTLVSYLLYLNGIVLLFLFFLFGIVLMIFARVVRNHLYNLGNERKELDAYRYQYVNEAFEQRDLVSAHKLYRFFENRYSHVNRGAAKVGGLQSGLNMSTRWIIEFLIVLLVIGFATLMPGQMPQLDQLAVSFAVIARLLPLSSKLMSNLQRLDYSGPVLNDLSKELNATENITTNAVLPEQPTRLASLGFKDVEIKVYGTSGAYFHKTVNLTLRPGNLYALTGTNGIGKSTFVKSILGSVDGRIESGTLSLVTPADEEAIPQLFDLRNRLSIAYVPQDPTFLDTSVLENVRYDFDVEDSKVDGLINSVGLREYIQSLPNGVQTRLGDKYGYLSGGQRQRLAIARALVIEAQLIVFDEPTSAADASFTANMISIIRKEARDAIVLIITHSRDVVPFCEAEILVTENEVSLHAER